MILPDFIGIGNEVLICLLSLVGILFCVGLRLYTHGIHLSTAISHTPTQSTNSNSNVIDNAEQVDSSEGTTFYNTGVLDTEYMESLRDVNYALDTNLAETEGSPKIKARENNARELREARAQGNIVLRLQYLNDRVRYVHAPPEMPILLFKRKFFADELENQHKSVRLIFQGRELKPSAIASRESPSRRRLCDYGVSDNSTIHCLISDIPPQSVPATSESAGHANSTGATIFRPSFATPDDLDFGTYVMMPLFAFLLVSVWLFRFSYAHYFTLFSTVALVCLSALFAGAVFTSATTNRRRTMEQTSVAAGDSMRMQ